MQRLTADAGAVPDDSEQLLDVVRSLLDERPPPPRATLEFIRSVLLQSRGEQRASTAQPISAPVAPPPAAQADAGPKRAPINGKREDMIRACQEQRASYSWSIGSQLAAPHPPLTGGARTAATLAAYGDKAFKTDAALGRPQLGANDRTADFRFDTAGHGRPQPQIGRNEAPSPLFVGLHAPPGIRLKDHEEDRKRL